MRTLGSIFYGVVAIAALSACEGVREVGEESGTPGWRLEPEIRIDGHEIELVPIRHLSVSEGGVVAVDQPFDRQIRLFDHEGEPIATIGREGRGPGEFSSINRLGWLGDTLWVTDAGLSRISLFGPGSSLLRILPVPKPPVARPGGPELPSFPVSPLGPLADGTIAVLSSDWPQSVIHEVLGLSMGPWLSRSPSRPTPDGVSLGRVSAEGEYLGPVVETWPTLSLWVRTTADGATAGGEYPFPNRVHFELSDRGGGAAIAFAELEGDRAGTLRVVLFGEKGDTVFDRSHPFPGEPIPASVADSAVSVTAAGWRGLSPQIMADYEDDLYVPALYPPIEQLTIGYDGSLWIRMRDSATGRPYLVLDSDGNLAAEVVVAKNIEIQRADTAHVWALETDEFDVQSVVRYRIVRNPMATGPGAQ